MRGRKHGPNRLTDYYQTHQTVMQQLVARGFVLADGLSFSPFGDGYILISGNVECLGGITLAVQKVLAVVDGTGARIRVHTVDYRYNAFLPGRGNILRYDGPHAHRPYHHKHEYDVLTGDRTGSILGLEQEAWPTLGEVLEELEAWYWTHHQELAGG